MGPLGVGWLHSPGSLAVFHKYWNTFRGISWFLRYGFVGWGENAFTSLKSDMYQLVTWGYLGIQLSCQMGEGIRAHWAAEMKSWEGREEGRSDKCKTLRDLARFLLFLPHLSPLLHPFFQCSGVSIFGYALLLCLNVCDCTRKYLAV